MRLRMREAWFLCHVSHASTSMATSLTGLATNHVCVAGRVNLHEQRKEKLFVMMAIDGSNAHRLRLRFFSLCAIAEAAVSLPVRWSECTSSPPPNASPLSDRTPPSIVSDSMSDDQSWTLFAQLIWSKLSTLKFSSCPLPDHWTNDGAARCSHMAHVSLFRTARGRLPSLASMRQRRRCAAV
jgi:hypothetical protein